MSTTEKTLNIEHFKNQLVIQRANIQKSIDKDSAASRDTSAAQDLLAEIKAALKRVGEGTFGQCVTCGAALDPDRLESYPHAAQCLTCKKSAEPWVPDITEEGDGDGLHSSTEVDEDQGDGEATVSPDPETDPEMSGEEATENETRDSEPPSVASPDDDEESPVDEGIAHCVACDRDVSVTRGGYFVSHPVKGGGPTADRCPGAGQVPADVTEEETAVQESVTCPVCKADVPLYDDGSAFIVTHPALIDGHRSDRVTCAASGIALVAAKALVEKAAAQESGGVAPSDEVDRSESLGKRFADRSIPQSVPGELREIPLEDIHPDPNNPRTEIGDVTGLAESIASLGYLIEPLLVNPRPEGGVIISAGHRRLAALKLLGRPTAECIVRDQSAAERKESQIIENLHRKDLSPLEEARGYKDLVGQFDFTQREVADRVGVSQAYVAKRLALIELPEPAQVALDSGVINLTDADELLKLRKHPKEMAAAWKATEEPYASSNKSRAVHEAVEYRQEKIKVAETKKTSKEKLKALGVAIVKEPGYEDRGKIQKLGKGYDSLDIKVADHKGQQCHAAYIDERTGRIAYVCTEPARHMGEDNGGTGDAPHDPRSMYQKRMDAFRVEEKRRHTFIREQVAKGVDLDETMKLIVTQLAPERPGVGTGVRFYGCELGETDTRSVCEWLFETTRLTEDVAEADLEEDEELSDYAEKIPTDELEDTLREFAGKSAANRERLAFALVATWAEYSMDPDWTDDPRPQCIPWLTFLEERGYEISELERELVAGAPTE